MRDAADDEFTALLRRIRGQTKHLIPWVLARERFAPLEIQTVLAKMACRRATSLPAAWDAVADLLERQHDAGQAAMFRNAAASMRDDGKRYRLAYPNNQEHIVDADEPERGTT